MCKVFYIFIVILIFSCSSGSQNATHIETKGISCDAVKSAEGILISGESSLLADRSKGTSQKDAYIANLGSSTGSVKVITVGNQSDMFRLDQLASSSGFVLASGYGMADKKALVLGMDSDLKLNWGLVSDSLEAFEEPASSMDANGNYLVVNKNLAATPYYAYFTLLTREGKVQWTQRTDHIDALADIVSLRNNNFLIAFKQKGAYIDGGTMKKYLMASSLWVTKDGAIIQKYKFLVDRDKFIDFNLHKCLEDSKGNIYYFGSGLLVNNRTDLFVIKTNAAGHVQWSYTYQTGHELVIKSADISKDDKIVIAADSYGKSGGFLLAGLGTDGKILWNNHTSTTPYEQIKSVFIDKDQFIVVYDKTLQAGILYCDSKGKSCTGKSKELSIAQSNADIQLSPNNAEFEATQCRWLPLQLQTMMHNDVKLISDCK
ncbi:MAG: hypothetical protein HOP11_13250 [Saprospiraceae bacterium]|nr:hypothetical protein [Saprospiraceae bacterium]